MKTAALTSLGLLALCIPTPARAAHYLPPNRQADVHYLPPNAASTLLSTAFVVVMGGM